MPENGINAAVRIPLTLLPPLQSKYDVGTSERFKFDRQAVYVTIASKNPDISVTLAEGYVHAKAERMLWHSKHDRQQ